MSFTQIKSYAKINLALNIIGKINKLHKIESIIAFVDLYDLILIKKIKSKKNNITFSGKFSQGINKKNTVSKLMKILEKKNFLKNQKFQIKINKHIPSQAGLGGGSMNAANILRYFVKKKIIKIKKKQIIQISKMVGSDVILGLNSFNTILTSKNKIKIFNRYKKIYTLIVKPNFGCSTREIYSKVKNFERPKFNRPNKNMFNLDYLKKMNNNLELIAFSKYPKLKEIKVFIENSLNPVFVRMSGSGSVLVAYFKSKKICELAKKNFNKRYKNYWCIASKTI